MYLEALHPLACSSNRVGPGNALTWISRRHWLGFLEISDNGSVVAAWAPPVRNSHRSVCARAREFQCSGYNHSGTATRAP